MGGKRINPSDIIGISFGRLTVCEYLGFYSMNEGGKKEHYYKGVCDCGNVSSEIERRNLTRGRTKSCGCIQLEGLKERITTHNLSKTRLYRTYSSMKKRCYNKNDSKYSYYGGRGITICEEWLGEDGFINFWNWSNSNGYHDSLSIDRIDNDGNYEPNNCRWATNKEQVVNRRRERIPIAISPEGEEIEISCMKDFISENNLDNFTVYKCLKGEYHQHRGWQFTYKKRK